MLGVREIVVGISLRMHKFDPRPVYVRTVVDKAVQGQVFLQVFRLPFVSIIPQNLHTHLHLHGYSFE